MDVTRRRLLRIGTVAMIGAVAGCSGNESDDGNEIATTTSEGGTETTESVATTAGKVATNEPLPAPTKGDADAPVVVESFEDFSCKFCAQFTLEILPQIEEQYIESGDVRYRRHDFPFLDPEWSWKAAHAARAVQDAQGDAKFFEYTDLLYQNYKSYSEDVFAVLATSVDVDPAVVREAVTEGQYQTTLEAEKELGEENGISKTPTVLVNGKQAESPRFADVAAAIESALESE